MAAIWAAETLLDLHNGFGLAVSASWGLANAVEPLVGAALLTAGDRERGLATRDRLLRFTGAAVLVGPFIGALIGAGASVLVAGDQWFPRLPRWFVGDAIGVMTVAPLFLMRGRDSVRSSRRAIMPVLILVATMAVALAPWSATARYGLTYLVVPCLILIALEVGPTAAALAVGATALVVEVSMVIGGGPFVGAEVGNGDIEAQMFLAMCAFASWVTVALTEDLVVRERVAAESLALAQRDELTGLGNRRFLERRLSEFVATQHRHGTPTTALFIDLDGFKEVNDRHGHAVGDAVLHEVAHRLRASLRDVDAVARVGGDEFVVATNECVDEDQARHLAARLEDAISRPIVLTDVEIEVGASVGVVFANRPVEDASAFIDLADRSMYQVKIARTLASHDPASPPPAPDRRAWSPGENSSISRGSHRPTANAPPDSSS